MPDFWATDDDRNDQNTSFGKLIYFCKCLTIFRRHQIGDMPFKRILLFLFSCFALALGGLEAQTTNISQLEKALNKLYGVEKIHALNQLTAHYSERDRKLALKYGKQAASLAEAVFSSENVLVDQAKRVEKYTAHFQLGHLYFLQEKYDLARKSVEKAYREADIMDDSVNRTSSERLLTKINAVDKREGFLKSKWRNLALKEKVSSASTDLKITSILTLAKKYEQLKSYDKAIEHYQKAINELQNTGDAQRIATLQTKVAALYDSLGNADQATAFYEEAGSGFEKLNDTTALMDLNERLQALISTRDSSSQTRPLLVERLPVTKGTDQELLTSMDRLQKLSEEYEKKEDFSLSLQYYKQYQELQQQLIARQNQKQLDSLELVNRANEIILLEQENELNAAEIKNQTARISRQQRFRNGLILGTLILFGLAGVFYWLFITKRKAHQRLQVTYNHLDTTQKQLSEAEKKIKKLLGQQVSADIAQALISDEPERGNIHKFVCILFLDIRDFTPFASSRTPEEVIAYQNNVFGFMIEIIARHHGVINQFMGDGFMATFGAPVSYENDVQNAFAAALEIVEEVNRKSENGHIPPTKIGIGMHAGKVVAGNVGTEQRKQYSITGTTVITAARIEQLNKRYASQLLVSESVINHLNGATPTTPEVFETKLKGMDRPIKIFKVA
ncbi:MAG: adenylate/guanylate cyclase domain-containing protein [Bacteroidota bacterium]